MIQYLHKNEDSYLQDLINKDKIDLIIPIPLQTIRWLYDSESKVILMSDSLYLYLINGR